MLTWTRTGQGPFLVVLDSGVGRDSRVIVRRAVNGGAAEKKAVGTAGCCPGPAAIVNLRFGRAYRSTDVLYTLDILF